MKDNGEIIDETEISIDNIKHPDHGLKYLRPDEKPGMPNMIDSECKIQSRAYLVKLFIENGADPNLLSPKVEHSPLHWLCYWGDWRDRRAHV